MLACDMAMRLRKTLGSSLEYLLASVCGRHSPNEFSCAHDHAARWSATQTCAQFPDHPKPKWVVWRGKSRSADGLHGFCPRHMTRFGDEICADASANIPDGAHANIHKQVTQIRDAGVRHGHAAPENA